ncbi:hypothetical protein [Vreelandella sp. TE19]
MKRSSQHGQALTEFIVVSTFLLVPLFLIVPVLAKVIFQTQHSIQALAISPAVYSAAFLRIQGYFANFD